MESFRQNLYLVPVWIIGFVFFILIYAFNWLGYLFKKKISSLYPDKDFSLGAAEGSLMGLMALLLAFSFGVAFTKFDARRQSIVEEANLLNTYYLRCTLYPDSVKKSVVHDFKNYVQSRMEYYAAKDYPFKIKEAQDKTNKYFDIMWNKNSVMIKDQNNGMRSEQLMPILISLKTITISREASRVAKVPTLIILVLLLLVFIVSFITGFGLKPGQRNLFTAIAFAAMTSIVLYLIMELGRPSQGFINVDNVEKEIGILDNKLVD
ncbi:MAG: hypothetical protein C5B52_19100 [Bacteroidetes bacterium]|nr:MAG: hypothetical protein C5B52_19100 [Bacteroidota bacterium]